MHRCWVFHTSQVLHIAMLLVLTLCCTACSPSSWDYLLHTDICELSSVETPNYRINLHSVQEEFCQPSSVYISQHLDPLPGFSGCSLPSTRGNTLIPGSERGLAAFPQQPSDSVCPALPWLQFLLTASVVGDLILAWLQRTKPDCTKHFTKEPTL